MPGSVVAPLGMSPPVITEFLQYLDLVGELPSRLLVVRTSSPRVEEGFRVMSVAVGRRYPHLLISDRVVDYQDVDTQERVDDFVGVAAEVLSEAAEDRPLRILISGGRKTMTTALATLGTLLPTAGIYHVVVPDIKTANARLEAMTEVMAEVARSPDPARAYEEHAEDLDAIFWPDPSSYHVVRIPVLAPPPEAVRLAAEALRGGMTRRRFLDEGGSREYLATLGTAGLLSVSEGGRIVPTDLGVKLGEALSRLLL